MAEKLFRSERESEKEEESGSNRTGVKETDFDNRAPVDHNCEEKKKKCTFRPRISFVKLDGKQGT